MNTSLLTESAVYDFDFPQRSCDCISQPLLTFNAGKGVDQVAKFREVVVSVGLERVKRDKSGAASVLPHAC